MASKTLAYFADDIARRWECEALHQEQKAKELSNPDERRLVETHARIKRECASAVRLAAMKHRG